MKDLKVTKSKNVLKLHLKKILKTIKKQQFLATNWAMNFLAKFDLSLQMARKGNRVKLTRRALILVATCCLFFIIQYLANRYHSSVYQLTPYSELTATYESTIASVSIQENIFLVDFTNCFDESKDELEHNKTNSASGKLKNSPTVDLAKCLNRLLQEADRLEEKANQQRNKQIDKQETATTTKTSTTTTLNSTAITGTSSLKDLYFLQSWFNGSFAVGGDNTKQNVIVEKDENAKTKVIQNESTISLMTKGNSTSQYYRLLEHFNLTSLAPNFDPVNRLADKYLYLSLKHVEQLDTILRHNFSADVWVNPVDASIDRRRRRDSIHAHQNDQKFSVTSSSSSSQTPLTNLKLSEFVDTTRLRHGARSCDENNAGTRTYGADLTAIVFVITKPDDYHIRSLIRSTWGEQFTGPDSTIRLYFAFGLDPALANTSAPQPNPEKEELDEARVAEESATYGDIVQWAFADGYYRLTIKSVAILRWASVYCPRVPVLFKVDADCLLNYDALKRFSLAVAQNRTNSGGNYYIYGNLWRRAAVLRSAKSKFFTSFFDYPQPIYPDYVGGPWYLAGPQLPLFMFRVAVLHSMPALLWEDLYVTGIVAEKLIDGHFPLSRHYMYGFYYNIDPDKFDYCMFNRSIILTQAFTQDNLKELWSRVTSRTVLRKSDLLDECSIDW